MKFIIDFFPILLFFFAYKSYDLFVATIVIVVSSIIQMALLKGMKQKIEFMHWFSLILIVLLGAITLLTKSASFIMYKVSILNFIFAFLLLYSHFFLKQNFIEKLLAKNIKLSKQGWSSLNQMWIGFFTITGTINYFFASKAISAKNTLLKLDNAIDELAINLLNCKELSSELVNACLLAQKTEIYWVNFKFYGVLALTISFVVIQTLWLMRKQNSS